MSRRLFDQGNDQAREAGCTHSGWLWNPAPGDSGQFADDGNHQRSNQPSSPPNFPVNASHEIMCDQTKADAILDQILHDAYRLELLREYLLKKRKINQTNP